MSITLGSQTRLTYGVVDAIGTFVNPTTATLAITLPDGTIVNPTITLPPAITGKLIYDFTTTQASRHTALWTTTAPITTGTLAFNVTPATSGAIFSIAVAKKYLNEDMTTTINDEEIAEFVDVVTEIVESKVGAVIPRTLVERVQGGHTLALTRGPVISIASINPWILGIGTEIVPVSAVRVDPDTWTIERIYGFWRGPYEVTYKVGRTVIPQTIIHGAKAVLDHLWETQRGSSLVGPNPVSSDDEAFSIKGKLWTLPKSVLEILQSQATGPRIR